MPGPLRFPLGFSLILILTLVASAPSAQNDVPNTHKAIVVFIDGLDARFLAEPVSKTKIPNLRKLLREGASGSVVGLASPGPESPGASAEGAVSLAPLTLEKPSPRTAAIYFSPSAGLHADIEFPAPGEAHTKTGAEFDATALHSRPQGLIDRVEAVFQDFRRQLWDDLSSQEAALYTLQSEKPDLLLVRFPDLAVEQQETGALSLYSHQTLENADDMLGQLLRQAPPGTLIAIVSDHGFETRNYIVRPRVLLPSMAANLEVASGLIGATTPAAADQLRKLIGDNRRKGIALEIPIAEVRQKVPALRHWVAAFDTLPNYIASDETTGPAVGPGDHHAVAGLWPTRPGYRGVFILAGPGVRPHQLGDIGITRIAPTLADALGLKLLRQTGNSASLWPLISR